MDTKNTLSPILRQIKNARINYWEIKRIDVDADILRYLNKRVEGNPYAKEFAFTEEQIKNLKAGDCIGRLFGYPMHFSFSASLVFKIKINWLSPEVSKL